MLLLGIKLILIAACGFMWRFGGAAGISKGVRRFGCPGLILISIILTQNWLGIASIPFLIAAASLGYGENSKLMKLLKNKYLVRCLCGLAYSLAATAVLWNNWWLLGFHVVFVTAGVTLAGNQKFQYNDKREEAFIGLLFGLMPIL